VYVTIAASILIGFVNVWQIGVISFPLMLARFIVVGLVSYGSAWAFRVYVKKNIWPDEEIIEDELLLDEDGNPIFVEELSFDDDEDFEGLGELEGDGSSLDVGFSDFGGFGDFEGFDEGIETEDLAQDNEETLEDDEFDFNQAFETHDEEPVNIYDEAYNM